MSFWCVKARLSPKVAGVGGLAEDNEATILQQGSENLADIIQGDFGAVSIFNEALIRQNGSNNGASIIQNTVDNTAVIIQTGSGNTSTVIQR